MFAGRGKDEKGKEGKGKFEGKGFHMDSRGKGAGLGCVGITTAVKVIAGFEGAFQISCHLHRSKQGDGFKPEGFRHEGKEEEQHEAKGF